MWSTFYHEAWLCIYVLLQQRVEIWILTIILFLTQKSLNV